MSTGEGTLAKNTLFSTLSNLTSFLLLVLMILAGRYLGEVDYGIFSFGLSFVFIFEIFTDFGLREMTIRDIARDRTLGNTYLGNILTWKLLLSCITFVLILIVINIMNVQDEARTVVYILGGSIILRSFKTTGRMFFQAYERFDLDALTLFYERVLLLLIGGMVLVTGRGLIAFVIVFVVVRFLDLLLTSSILHFKLVRIIPRFDIRLIRRIQLEALPVGIFLLALNLYSYIDTIMLSAFRSYGEVGWYNAAYKLYEGTAIFPAILCAVVAPRLSRYFIKDRDSHRDLTLRSIKYMFIIALPIVVFGMIMAGHFIQLLFGPEYLPSVRAFQVLLIGIIFVFQSWLFNTLMISINRQKSLLHAILIGLGINVVLNLILIPQYGILGASIATVSSEAAIFIFYLFAIGLFYEKVPFLRLGIRPFLASMIVLILSGFRGFSSSYIDLAGLIMAYILLLFIFKVFDKEERQLIRRYLGYQ